MLLFRLGCYKKNFEITFLKVKLILDYGYE